MIRPNNTCLGNHGHNSRQWRSLLAATVTEFTSQTKQPSDTRTLMRRVGIRFAAQTPLPSCKTLEEFEEAIRNVWQEMDLGWVTLEESGRTLKITHHCSANGILLDNAFGESTPLLAPSFLEGVYQKWLSNMGAGEALHVRQVSEPDQFNSIEYALSL